MMVDVVTPSACTVDDLWRVPAAVARRAGRAALDAQRALSAILERLEVPVLLCDDGRLTFFPHDPADVAAIRAAQTAARTIHAHLRAALR
ncbi:hypothetical protein AB0M46_24885 [Dactylosporangium sp. NPDC051485]|uniref:hypothetical protein n=1 Tax=Dactylosporangium sp. NPDC051485 TaxID=3154846 RepID=UPI0034404C84